MKIIKNINALVDKFLSWPLPRTVCSDYCVTDRSYVYPRSGTNLLDGFEAQEMIEYLLEDVPLTIQEMLKAQSIDTKVDQYFACVNNSLNNELVALFNTEKEANTYASGLETIKVIPLNIK